MRSMGTASCRPEPFVAGAPRAQAARRIYCPDSLLTRDRRSFVASLLRMTTGLALGTLMPLHATWAQTTTRTLVALFAHPDDEVAVAPILARYARERVQIYEIYVTGGEGGAGQGQMFQRPDTFKAGEDLARIRADEARCSATALGVNRQSSSISPTASLATDG